MFCPNCGKENSPFAKFCENCGAEIPDSPAPEQNAPQQQPQPMNFNEQPAQPMTPNDQQPQSMGFNNQQPQPMGFNNQQPQPMNFNEQPAQPMTPNDQQPQSMGFNNQQPQPMGFNNQQPQPMMFNEQQPAQPMTFGDQPSRYQEYNMSDVVTQKKSYKKLIIIIAIVLSLIALTIAGIFVVKIVRRNLSLGKIKEAPATYIAASYQKTAQAIGNQDDVIKVLSSNSKQKTVRQVVNRGNGESQTLISSYDADARKAYYKFESDLSSQKASVELYSNLDKNVLKGTINGKSFDYYLDSQNLRTNAADSIFGPGNKNGFNIQQKDYDTFMDVYEFVYNNLKKPDDQVFGLKALGEKITADIDKCGNVQVKDDTTKIFDEDVKCFAVTHTFTDTSIVDALYVDIKDWATTNLAINESIKKSIEDALKKADPMNYKSYLQKSNLNLKFNHYINRDNNMLMKVEASLDVQGSGVIITLTLGKDPASSNKYGLSVAALGMKQNVTIERQSDASQSKYVMTFDGAAVNGSMTYTRNKSTGEIKVDQNLSSSMMSSALGGTSKGTSYSGITSMSTADSSSQVVPMANSLSLPKGFSISTVNMNATLKSSGDSVTIILIPKDEKSASMGISSEIYISNKAEIPELTSTNNILNASKAELEAIFKGTVPNPLGL